MQCVAAPVHSEELSVALLPAPCRISCQSSHPSLPLLPGPRVCVQALALQCAGQGCSSGQQSPLLLSYPLKEWLEAVGV